MIEMKNFRVFIPGRDDALLGYVGENQSRRFAVKVDEVGSWSYKLDLRNSAGVANVIDLIAGDGELYAEIERAAVQFDGKAEAQIRAIDGEKVKCSNVFPLHIGGSVQATEYFASLPPSEFEQLEQRLTALKADAELAAVRASGDAAEVRQTAEDIHTDVERFAAIKEQTETAASRGEAAAGEIAGLILRADAVAGRMDQAAADAQAAQAAAETARAGAEAAAGSAAQEASELAAGQTAEALRGELAGLTERSESAANRAEEAARRAESLATGVTMADLQSLIQCGSAALAEGLPPGGILFVEEASG